MGRMMMEITEVQVKNLHPHEKNPRLDAAQVEDLVASIREHGIEVPLVAAPALGSATEYVVLAGHRRLTAAHELGLESVPVQVRPDLVDARDQLAFMATENLQRDQLTAMEEARLFQDMLDLGWSQAEVAKATAVKRPRVAERVKLGKLGEETGEKVHRGQITVDDALVIAEFSDDPDAVDALEASAGTNMFDWRVSEARRRREQRAVVAEVERAGGRVVAGDVDFVPIGDLISDSRFDTKRLNESVHLDNEAWAALEVSEHASCPGHCARVGYAGAITWGCDQAEVEHPGGVPVGAADAQPEPDPWAELAADDFATASVHRARHLGDTLTRVSLEDEAKTAVIAKLKKAVWTGYAGQDEAIAFFEAMTGAEGKAAVTRVLRRFPLASLVYLAEHSWDILAHDRYMAQGKQGSSYWGPKGAMRRLLDLTGYVPSEVEKRACELATGAGWFDDGTTTATTEGGAR